MRVIAGCVAGVLLLSGCGDQKRTVEETRRVSMRDQNLKLDATSDERFGPTSPRARMMEQMDGPEVSSPVEPGEIPSGWQEMPGNSFRLLNYRFGTGGEVYVSLSRGGVQQNVNRWIRQFGGAALGPEEMENLETVDVAGYEGVWVTAQGSYVGMGSSPRENYALAGAVAEGENGEILTIKMIGPSEEVARAEPELKQFVATLEKSG